MSDCAGILHCFGFRFRKQVTEFAQVGPGHFWKCTCTLPTEPVCVYATFQSMVLSARESLWLQSIVTIAPRKFYHIHTHASPDWEFDHYSLLLNS